MSKIEVYCDAYLPGFRAGGPIASISRIIGYETAHDFRVITRDREVADQPYPGVAQRSWVPVGNARVAYLRPGGRDVAWAFAERRGWKPDLIYLNSLQSPWFTLLPAITGRFGSLGEVQLMIAPRGEASVGAQSKKNLKKRIARPAIRQLLNRSMTWHLSTVDELHDLERWWGGELPSSHRFLVQADPPISPAPLTSLNVAPGTPKITFASRIDRMKGLDTAIAVVAAVEVEFAFEVRGTVTDSTYWDECRQLARRELPAGTMNYLGEYLPSQAQEIFRNAAVLILPTHGENFGHAISEALSVGCPVVVPAVTPWTDLVESGGGHIMRGQAETVQYISQLLTEAPEKRVRRRELVHRLYVDWYEHNRQSGSLFD